MENYSEISIENIIIHQIFKSNKGQKTPPDYSDIESELNDEIRDFLKSRIIETVGSIKAHNVVFDRDSASPIPNLINTLLLNDYNNADFFRYSKEIANFLNDIQTGRNSGGYVVLIFGKNMGKKIIGILKIEAEEGARLEKSERNGKKTFEITRIKDLILSKNTRLLKIGIFYQNENTVEVEGRICDNQLTGLGEIATFFLKTFLGCKFMFDPAIQTKDFFTFSLRFIKEKIDDPVTQNTYMLHLQSYLLKPDQNINPRIFAISYLDIKHRQVYENYLKEKGMGIKEIILDPRYIKSQIQKSTLAFENGIEITGSNQRFEEDVKIQHLDDGSTEATVKSRLKKI